MKSYIDYLLLKEYRRTNRGAEYRVLKKRLLERLNAGQWTGLGKRLLEEDSKFVSDAMENDQSGLAIELVLDELLASNEDAALRSERFRWV
jgi:hypothetical protein